MVSCYDNTFPRRQPICLDHNRGLRAAEFSSSKTLDRIFGRLSHTIPGRRYPVPGHEVFRKNLASLESCRSSIGSDNAQSSFNKQIYDPGSERRFWTNKREVNAV